MRSRGLKKILSRERENALSPRVSTKGVNEKETAPTVAVPVPASSLHRSIHVESLLDGARSDNQNTPFLPSAAGDRPLPLSSGPASSSTAYPANPATSSKTIPLGDLSESDSDSDGSQSSGKDSCSKASTMTRSGSSTSVSIGHTKKVCFLIISFLLHTCGITSIEFHIFNALHLCLQIIQLNSPSLFISSHSH